MPQQTRIIMRVLRQFHADVVYDTAEIIQTEAIKNTRRDTGLSQDSYRWTIGRPGGHTIVRGNVSPAVQKARQVAHLQALRNWETGNFNPVFSNEVSYILHALRTGGIQDALNKAEARIKSKYGGDNPNPSRRR